MITISIVILAILLALVYDVLNGAHDSSLAIATVVSTGTMSARAAICMAAIFNLIGGFYGNAIAKTIGASLIASSAISIVMVCMALITASFWNYFTMQQGIPNSSSHCLVGSLIGSAIAVGGLDAIQTEGLLKILKSFIISPFVGAGVAILLSLLITWISYKANAVWANKVFRYLQMMSSSLLSYAHASNDAAKTSSIITMLLVAAGWIHFGSNEAFKVPFYVVAACAVAIAIGTALGGWRVVHTLGRKVSDLRPIDGFAAELTSAATIFAASFFGTPVSTTHVCSSAIIGVGLTKDAKKINLGTIGNMFSAWIITIPLTALLSFSLMSSVQCIQGLFE